MTSDAERPAEPIEATAYSKVDGIETWDLTGEPSDEAYGMEDGSTSAIYETPDEPRRVRIVLEGRTVETTATLVDFYRSGSGTYSFGVSSEQQAAAGVESTFRDLLGQLGLDVTLADRYAREVAVAPGDQSEVISIGSGPDGVELGSWTVGTQATYTPSARLGRVILGGTSSEP